MLPIVRNTLQVTQKNYCNSVTKQSIVGDCVASFYFYRWQNKDKSQLYRLKSLNPSTVFCWLFVFFFFYDRRQINPW